MNKVVKTLILVLIAIFAASQSAYCGPVRNMNAIYSQPDGSTFEVKVRGDEWLRIRTTSDGCAISKDEQGWWCYAIYDFQGRLDCTEYKVGSKAPSEIILRSRNIPYELLQAKAAESRNSRNIWNAESIQKIRKAAAITKSTDSRVSRKGLAILAQFQDTKFSHTKEDFHNLLNQTGYKGTGSAKDYYEAQFGENWEFDFDVTDIITLPFDVKYYGANNPTSGQDSKAAELVRDACKKADELIDFSIYDQDADGEVDNVYLFMAGYDEAEHTDQPDLIWSHQWYILDGAGIRLTCDNVIINRYACSSELSGRKSLTGIGTFCHEYAHTFGLPDFYDTNYDEDGAWAAGLWRSTSLMDGGNYNNNSATPPNLNAIERKLLGLSEPEPLEAGKSYTLEPIHKNGKYHIIETKTEGEYFLFECRSNEGWDRYIGGSGMLVYHIDENAIEHVTGYRDVSKWTYNTVNADPLHQCADLIEADKRADDITNVQYPYSDIRGVFYPQSKVTSLTAKNTPSFKLWDGSYPEVSLISITKSGSDINFNVIKGDKEPEIPEISAFSYQAFPDALFILFQPSGTTIPDKATIEWRKQGEAEYNRATITSSDQKYSYLITDLESGNVLYSIRLWFESNSLPGTVFSVQVMTKRSPEVSWPYFYLTDGGNINKSEGFIAHAVNTSGAAQKEWFLDGQKINTKNASIIFPEHSGDLTCVITWEDGSTDTITKAITINE